MTNDVVGDVASAAAGAYGCQQAGGCTAPPAWVAVLERGRDHRFMAMCERHAVDYARSARRSLPAPRDGASVTYPDGRMWWRRVGGVVT